MIARFPIGKHVRATAFVGPPAPYKTLRGKERESRSDDCLATGPALVPGRCGGGRHGNHHRDNRHRIGGGGIIAAIANQAEEDIAASEALRLELEAELNPPPTDRQLNFIDALIAEREVDLEDLEEDPQTIDEAGELIEHLLTLPHREGRDT